MSKAPSPGDLSFTRYGDLIQVFECLDNRSPTRCPTCDKPLHEPGLFWLPIATYSLKEFKREYPDKPIPKDSHA